MTLDSNSRAIRMHAMNIGEKNELLLKITLVSMRDRIMPNNGPIAVINSVGFANKEYGQLPSGLTIGGILLSSDSELECLASLSGISKAPSRSKSDVNINGEGYSVKSFASAPPALVNHTARPGFEVACKHVGANIADLDKLVENYWQLRTAGRIREDIKNTDSLSPFSNAKGILGPLLNYFLFLGTGSGLADHSAQFILDYENPVYPATWRVLTPDKALDELWDKLIFSLRSKKGMPSNYPNNRDKSANNSTRIWTRYFQNEYRGALHIRATK